MVTTSVVADREVSLLFCHYFLLYVCTPTSRVFHKYCSGIAPGCTVIRSLDAYRRSAGQDIGNTWGGDDHTECHPEKLMWYKKKLRLKRTFEINSSIFRHKRRVLISLVYRGNLEVDFSRRPSAKTGFQAAFFFLRIYDHSPHQVVSALRLQTLPGTALQQTPRPSSTILPTDMTGDS